MSLGRKNGLMWRKQKQKLQQQQQQQQCTWYSFTISRVFYICSSCPGGKVTGRLLVVDDSCMLTSRCMLPWLRSAPYPALCPCEPLGPVGDMQAVSYGARTVHCSRPPARNLHSSSSDHALGPWVGFIYTSKKILPCYASHMMWFLPADTRYIRTWYIIRTPN